MIRDAIYDLVARNRYRWFRRRDACVLPTKQAALLQFNSVPAAGEQLKALSHDDHPNVGNLIDYSYRKPGDYKFSQVWYERALKPIRTMY
jgi:hypothetical protein